MTLPLPQLGASARNGELFAFSHSPLASATSAPSELAFVWRLDAGCDDDCLRWWGDVDAAFGYLPRTFPRTLAGFVDALHPEDRERVLDVLEAHGATGEPYHLLCRTVAPDGTQSQWTHEGHFERDAGGQTVAVWGTLQPNVEAPASQPLPSDADALETRTQALLRAAARLNAQLDLQEVCEAICQEAARTLGAPSAVMLFNRARDAFVPTALTGMPLDYDKRYIPTVRSIYDRHVAQMGTLFSFTDAQATPDLPNHTLYGEVDMRTIGIASLIRDGEVLGLLKVYSFGQTRAWTPDELKFLQGLADLAAPAIANARLLSQSEQRLANIGALRAIDKAILGSSDVGIALGVVLEQVVSRMGADAASALLLDPHTRTLRYAAGRGFRTQTPRRTDWQLGEGLAGRAALERRMVYVPDLARPEPVAANLAAPDAQLSALHSERDAVEDEDSLPLPPSALKRRMGIHFNEGFAAYYGVPLIANGQIKGVLEMWHRAPLALAEEELNFLETLAGQAAIAVDNAELFRDLQRSNDELVLAYDSTLAGWSRALDLRDKETEGHSQRVTHETLRLARELGIGDEELVHIRRGALLHDIGKMGVPDAILLKPGPLSDEEWDVMKKHPVYALELLAPTQYLRRALDIPYSHHEKWDGSGYPRGLKGEQIPLAARLFAVVDVWDALRSDRPYRENWPAERVLEYICAGAGSHFDPAIVEAFLRLHADESPPSRSME